VVSATVGMGSVGFCLQLLANTTVHKAKSKNGFIKLAFDVFVNRPLGCTNIRAGFLFSLVVSSLAVLLCAFANGDYPSGIKVCKRATANGYN